MDKRIANTRYRDARKTCADLGKAIESRPEGSALTWGEEAELEDARAMMQQVPRSMRTRGCRGGQKKKKNNNNTGSAV